MFKIDLSANRLCRLEQRSFGDLGFGERAHLQEWLVSSPDAFGEDLLIVQKEFDGFDETRERLDLLALDKAGHLVIIENKLDDSGRDVVWQAQKYAAYCSSLSTPQIVDLYRAYLDRYHGGTGAEAASRISEFLDVAELEEVVLNPGNSQRIMLVAAHFRKEVTATVMWLLGHEIPVQCFRVTPYSLGEELILDINQIIPTPEAEEFMIGISSKEKSEAQTAGVSRKSHRLRLEFWTQALDAMRRAGLTRYANISPSKDNWITSGTGVAGCHFTLVLTSRDARVQLNLESADAAQNKAMFDLLMTDRPAIEGALGEPLDWLRLEDNKVSRIVFSKEFDGFNRDNWPEMIAWMVERRKRMERVMGPKLKEAAKSLKTVEIEDGE